jgi:hypothetical protein
MASFEECVRTGKGRSSLERHRSASREFDVNATPAFFLGDVLHDGSIVLKKRINGALPFDAFREAIMDFIPREQRERVGGIAQRVPVPLNVISVPQHRTGLAEWN